VALTAECDLVAVLLDEHSALQSQTEPLQECGCDARTVVALVMELCWYGRTLQRHLDSVVRRYLPDGQARADRCLGAYLEVERMVAELRRQRLGEAQAVPLLDRLICRLRDYLTDQEREPAPVAPACPGRRAAPARCTGHTGRPRPGLRWSAAVGKPSRTCPHSLPQCIHPLSTGLWTSPPPTPRSESRQVYDRRRAG
jgi:hypothetical protein